MKIVRCNSCGWIGKDEEMGLTYRDDEEYCPRCRGTDWLMDVGYGCNFDSQELETLWELFGEIPVDDEDKTEEEFLEFEEGTDKIEIWHWFDEKYPDGVVALMNGGKRCRSQEK